jgi:hypothetical protein
MNSLPVLPYVRAFTGGRAPTWWGREMATQASSVVRVPAAASWLRRFHGFDLHLLEGPLLGTTLEQLLSPSEASQSQGQTEADNPESPDAATRLNRTTLAADRSPATRRRSMGAQVVRKSDGVRSAVIAERVAARASIGDLQKWAAAPVGSTAAQPRAGSASKAAPPTATSLWLKVSTPQPTASVRNRLTVPALPLEAESNRYWTDSARRGGDAMKRALAAAGASFQGVLPRLDGTTEHASASGSDTRFAKPVITGYAAGALLARCLGYERSAARPRVTGYRGAARPSGVSQRPLPRYTYGPLEAAEAPGKELPPAYFPARLREPHESTTFSPAVAERPRANSIWADPPLENSDYSTPYSGVQTSTRGAVAASGDTTLTEPVAPSRGFEPGRIVAPRLMKGRGPQYGTARIQSQSEPGEESLVVLAEQIKKILDEEARRHGIPV